MLPQRLRSAALPLVALLLLGACSDQAPVADDGPTRGTDRTPSGDGSDVPSESPTPTQDGANAGDTTIPAYFVGDTDRAGARLYREFQRVDGDPLEAAAELLTSGSSLDPDYRTLFPGGSLARVGYERGAIVVTVADDSWYTRAPGMSSAQARLAVQQLVYTLQGVAQKRVPVVVHNQGGGPVPLFGIDTADGLTAAPPLDVLSHINLTAPEQGAVVDDGSLEISGVGNSFEANVGWEIRRGDEVVMDGFATMEGWMGPRLFPFETTVDVSDLESGDYTLWVTTDDPSGGTEGVGAMTDDKVFTVR